MGKVKSRTVYVCSRELAMIGVPVRDPVDSSSWSQSGRAGETDHV